MSRLNNAVQAEMKPPASGVAVRMYNTGFGDCFLLAFRAEDGTARYLLIDCGVHHQYSGQAKIMQAVATDIARATGGRLHVVVVTHQHTDHLYGFKHGREIFEKMQIDDLWLAWTEDPSDPVARQLKKRYALYTRALAAAVQQIGLSNEPLAEQIQSVLGFEYPNALAAAGGQSAELDYLRAKSGKKLQSSKDYRHPGEPPLALPGVKGVKVYVLGPPRNAQRIDVLEKESEMYPELAALNARGAFAAAVLAAADEAAQEEVESLIRRSQPFDQSLIINPKEARRHKEFKRFFARAYGFSSSTQQGSAWRRIDSDWLAAAPELALAVNNYTNNTSLVLAFELTEPRPHKVLLFAADAQVGNWLSWHDLTWPSDEQPGKEVKVADLLQRAVLYKVGHHGSRNATLSEKGLELMEHTDLVAMIPVDETWAKTKQHWEHPDDKLLEHLKEKTRGRVIRMDEIPSGNAPPPKPPKVGKGEWKAFLSQLDWDRSGKRLWIQYTVPE